MKRLYPGIIFYFVLMTVNAQIHQLAKSWGTPNEDNPASMVLDKRGNIIVSGRFDGVINFNPGGNGLVSGGTGNYIAMLDSTWHYIWQGMINTGTYYGPVNLIYDPSGFIYNTGSFIFNVDFDPGPNTFFINSNFWEANSYILKLTKDGAFKWAIYLEGKGHNYIYSAIQDHAGNIIVCGTFQDTIDFKPGSGKVLSVAEGYSDTFIAKYNTNGQLVWGKQLPGSGAGSHGILETDSDGNIYLTGSFNDKTDFDPGPDTFYFQATLSDPFLLKLDANGNFMWANHYHNVSNASIDAIEIDDKNNIILGGDFIGTMDFDPGPGTYTLTTQSNADAFIMKLNSLGNLIWVDQFAGNNEWISDLESDHEGNIYSIGTYNRTIDLDPGTGQFILPDLGNNDIFVSRVDSNGFFVWGKAVAGNKADLSYGIEVTDNKRVYLTGTFEDTISFALNDNVIHSLTSRGSTDVFLLHWSQCENTRSDIFPTACSSYTSPSGRHVWKQSGVYFDTLQNRMTCDSLITVHLEVTTFNTFVNRFHDHLEAFDFMASYQWVDCDNQFSPFPGAIYRTFLPTQSGDYAVILERNGCMDTTACIFFCKDTYFEFEAESCGPYTSPSGDNTWTEPGIYFDTITNISGCDSLITIILVSAKPALYITQENNTLIAHGTEEGFAWVDCDNDFVEIPGVFGPFFTPSENGNYAVVGEDLQCRDTSACFSFIMTGTNAIFEPVKFNIYPNPTRDLINIDLTKSYSIVKVVLYDAEGFAIYKNTYFDKSIIPINLELIPGLYFAFINSGEQIGVQKFIVD